MSIRTSVSRAAAMIDPALRRQWGLIAVMALVMAVLEIIGAAAVFGLIGAVTNPELLIRIPLIGPALAGFVRADPKTSLQIFAVCVALFFVVKNLVIYTEINHRERTELRTMASITGRLLRGYLDAPYVFHLQRNSAELFRNIGHSVELVTKNVMLSCAVLLSEVLTILGLVATLMVAEPVVTSVTAGVLGLLLGGILHVSRHGFILRGQAHQGLQARMFQSIQECLGAVKDIKVTGREDFFLRRFNLFLWERGRVVWRNSTLSQIPRLATETAMVVGLVVLVSVAIGRGESGSRLVSLLGLFAYVGFRVLPAFNRIIMQFSKIHGGAAAVDLIWADFKALCLSHPVQATLGPPVTFSRSLELRDIHFTFPESHRQVLNGLNLSVARGEAIGIVGVTGAGKSTLVDIILGLLHPDSGDILVDGLSVIDNPRSWQQRIGYVPQTIFLTDDTLRRNIAFGIDDAEIDDDRLRQATEMAQMSSFITSLPQGYDTRVGERGVRLSGGQRQRIGVARALYHDPELLVFDEATSALDSGTELEISEAINALAGRKTLILVAHRLSTLKNCNRLVVLQDGIKTAEGNFDQLYERDETFRRMVELSTFARAADAMPGPDDGPGMTKADTLESQDKGC